MLTAGELTLDYVLALKERGERDRSGRFFIEGVRFLVRAVDRGAEVEGLVVARRMLSSPLAQTIVRRLKRGGVPVLAVSEEEFSRVTLLGEPQGVGAVVRQRWTPLDRLARPGPNALWVAIEEVRSPGNLGTLLRTCEAAGASGVIAMSDHVDPHHPSVVRATMGSLFSQRLVRAPPAALRSVAGRAAPGRPAERDYLVVGAAPDGGRDFRTLSYRRPVVLVFGGERKGLSAPQRAICDELVAIPMAGECDSLNLAIAASLLLYEVYRQRAPAGRPGGAR